MIVEMNIRDIGGKVTHGWKRNLCRKPTKTKELPMEAPLRIYLHLRIYQLVINTELLEFTLPSEFKVMTTSVGMLKEEIKGERLIENVSASEKSTLGWLIKPSGVELIFTLEPKETLPVFL